MLSRSCTGYLLLPVRPTQATWSTGGLAGTQPSTAFYRPWGCWALQVLELGCHHMQDLTLADPGIGDNLVKGRLEHFSGFLFSPNAERELCIVLLTWYWQGLVLFLSLCGSLF